MKHIALPILAICLVAVGIGAVTPPARASAEGRRNTAILLGIATAIAIDKYADKRAEEAYRSRYGYYDRYEPRYYPQRAPAYPVERHRRVVVRVERHDYAPPVGYRRPYAEPRPYDDGPRYWREPWAD
jgi:hypothetical protein